MVVQITDLEDARREVVEAAREWAYNIDHRDHDLLAVLRRKITGLVMIEKSLAMTQRERDLHDIKQLYGGTDVGREMLLQVMEKWALIMLPDEAIHELAELHRTADRRN